jgi:hypothetical protein
MTTILYHNKTLLADSRANRKDSAQRGSKGEFVCVQCEHPLHAVRNSSIKIQIAPSGENVLFRGETVRAAAGSGMAHVVSSQIQALFNLGNYEQAYKDAYVFTPGRVITIEARLLIVTDKSVYVIDFDDSNAQGLHANKYSLEETVAIGSGGMAAKTAILAYNADSFEAMRVASIADKSTGGPIRYVDFNQEKLEVLTYKPNSESKEPKKTELIQPKPSKAPRHVKKPVTDNEDIPLYLGSVVHAPALTGESVTVGDDVFRLMKADGKLLRVPSYVLVAHLLDYENVSINGNIVIEESWMVSDGRVNIYAKLSKIDTLKKGTKWKIITPATVIDGGDVIAGTLAVRYPDYQYESSQNENHTATNR